MGIAAGQGSGVRLELLTAATWIEVDVLFTRYSVPSLGNLPRDAVVATTVDGGHLRAQRFDEGNLYTVGPTGLTELRKGRPTSIRIDLGAPVVGAGRRRVAMWLPHTAAVELLGIRADADLVPAPVDAPAGSTTAARSATARTPRRRWGSGRSARPSSSDCT